MTEKYQPIPHRLKNMAVGGHVAGAIDIYDDRLFKNQQDVNAGFEAAIAGLNNQNYVTVEATDEDTSIESIMTRAGVTPQKDTVYRVGFWDGEQYDESKYSEYAWNEAAEEWKLLDVKEYTLATADDFIEPDAEKRAKVVPVGAAADVYGAYEENPEFVKVLTDSEGKILEETRPDGTKEFCADVRVKGSFIVEKDVSFTGSSIKSIENPEYIQVTTDSDSKILQGIKPDGSSYIRGDLQVEGDVNLSNEVIHSANSHEYLKVTTDAQGKILNGIKKDGSHYIYNVQSESIDTLREEVEEFVAVNEIVDNPECIEAKIDDKGKVLGYRDANGVLHENAGIETPFVKITGDRFDILSLFPPEKIVPLLKNFKFISHESAGNWNDFNGNRVTKQPYYPLTLLHFSDIHEDYYNLSRISKFYHTYKDYIDDVVFTGDFVLNTFNPSKTTPLWNNCDAKDFLYVLGNHDACSNLSPFTPVSPKQEYDNYIEPYLDKTNIIAVENHCYWHKDYTEAISPECSGGVRFIAIDQYHWYERDIIGEYVNPVYADGTTVDTGQQETWLRGLLDDALSNGYAVITALHSPVNCDAVVDVDSSFNAIDKIPTAQYSQIPTTMLDAIQDFIDAGGEFICWMAGHMHQDWFVQIKDYTDQLLMVMDTGSSSMMDRDNYLMYNTPYTDKFNIVSIEPVKKYIRLYRIGMTFDRHGRHVGSMVYDYKNKKVIYNS